MRTAALGDDRNRATGIDVAAKRRERADLAPEAHPQHGVDVLAEAFGSSARDRPPGVREAG